MLQPAAMAAHPLVRANTDDFSVFVGDLAPDVTDYVLQETFRQYFPSVRSAKVITDPATGRSKGYGFVRFSDEAERDRAMGEMNGRFMSGRPIRVSLATARRNPGPGGLPHPAELDPTNTTLFIGGLAAGVSEEQLRSIFARYGDIVYTKIPAGKGCGFVQFVERPAAEAAMAEMNGAIVGSSAIRISWGRSTSRAAAARDALAAVAAAGGLGAAANPLAAAFAGLGAAGYDPSAAAAMFGAPGAVAAAAAAGFLPQQAAALSGLGGYGPGAHSAADLYGAGAFGAGSAAAGALDSSSAAALMAAYQQQHAAGGAYGSLAGGNTPAGGAAGLTAAGSAPPGAAGGMLGSAFGGASSVAMGSGGTYDSVAGADVSSMNAAFIARAAPGLISGFAARGP